MNEAVKSSENQNVYISVSGMIGAGKSTLAKNLGDLMGLKVYYEPVADNCYLEDFYKDMKSCSFAMQVFLLNKRFQQQQEIIWSKSGAIQDRTIYEDGIFAKMLMKSGLMDERDYDTYKELSDNMCNFMRQPNLIVHLDVSPEESLARIKSRERGCETTITIEYLQALYEEYDIFLDEISKVIPVIKIDYYKFQSTEIMAAQIQKEYDNMTMIRNVKF